ncbi:zeta toxin family protein [Candidatus Saccharibacteria bacterium]|nr:zeta toxin family protein [Candidatus Saccharibacteria bacterium]
MFEGNHALTKVIQYLKAQVPSMVKPEWQVKETEYPQILAKVLQDFTQDATRTRHLTRIAGISGSGKTTQILPAALAYAEKNHQSPILVAARRFVEYHPHLKEIQDYYGVEDLRQNTDDFTTTLMFLTLTELIKNGYDIILDIALADPEIEGILLQLLTAAKYQYLLLMIAVSPAVTETFLKGRAWRHTKTAEKELIRATSQALQFYASAAPDLRIILWSVYDHPPIYDGPIQNCLEIFADYSARETLPASDDDARRDAKIQYLKKA